MLSAILFILVLGVLVFVHELGHFLAARSSNIKVTEFGLGLPPKAYGYTPKDSEVEYTLNWLPIGGFVKIYGEDYEALKSDDPDYNRSFVKATKIRQVFVMIAGVSMNFLIAILLLTMAAWWGTPVITDDNVNRDGFYVISVNSDSPGSLAGLESGVEITSINNGAEVVSGADLDSESFARVIQSTSENVELEIVTNGKVKQITITPEVGAIAQAPDQKAIGVYADSLVTQRAGFVEGIKIGVTDTLYALGSVAKGFGGLIADSFTGSGKETISKLSGPLGIAQLSEQAFSIGLGSLFSFTAFLSLNLVVLNLLPIPALDGGRILFVIIEAIKGSRLNPKFAGYTNLVGFALLLILMFAVTAQDIIRIF